MVSARKIQYGKKLIEYVEKYTKILTITVNNVGSKSMALLRKKLRGRAEILMGKNTMVRKVLRDYVKETGNEKVQNLISCVEGNSGFVFTTLDTAELREEIEAEKVQSAAKAGSIAPVDVFVPAGPTGMEPTMTNFFQALNIPTRIERGQISITDEQQLVFKGEKVGVSEASLLSKLGVQPFYYGVRVQSVYDDGQVFSAAVLALTEADIAGGFFSAMGKIAGLCLEIEHPTVVSVPQEILNAYKDILALAIGTKAPEWDHLKYIKEVLADPSKFAGGGGGGGGGVAAAGGGAPAAVEEEEEEESSVAAGGMFGGSGSGSDSSDSSDSSS